MPITQSRSVKYLVLYADLRRNPVDRIRAHNIVRLNAVTAVNEALTMFIKDGVAETLPVSDEFLHFNHMVDGDKVGELILLDGRIIGNYLIVETDKNGFTGISSVESKSDVTFYKLVKSSDKTSVYFVNDNPDFEMREI